MGMPQTAEIWTADRIRALPDDGLRHEVVAGEHLVTPSPRAPHEVAVSEIEALLRPYVRANGLGRVIHSPADLEPRGARRGVGAPRYRCPTTRTGTAPQQ